MENRGTRQNIKYISCFGPLVLHRKNGLSLLCDARSTTLTNRLRHKCDIYQYEGRFDRGMRDKWRTLFLMRRASIWSERIFVRDFSAFAL
jgi:hypothetical protein